MLIETRGLSKSYRRGKQVLHQIDFAVPRGTVLGLLGKNGSGKTTLIKCLIGLLQITEGSARVLGEDPWTLSAAAKAQLGYVPQVIALYPWMKVKQIIPYVAAFYPTWNDTLVADLVQRWELPENDRVGTLSVGQAQKLAIVLALGHEPRLLVLDEPAASLDPLARREFLREILEIAADNNRTVLFSTHITSDVERVADTVAIMRDGRITFHGELSELKDSLKRLHIRSQEDLPVSFAVPGSLSIERHGREALVAMRGATPELIADLRSRWSVDVDVEDLNLEDIFLELHRTGV